MEGFFYGLPYLFAKRDRTGYRQGQNAPKDAEKIGEKVAQFEDPAAEQEEVGRRAPEHGQYHIDAHLAVSCGHRLHKERHRNQDPKEEVQEAAQKPQADPHPEHAEEVVQHTHSRAQGQRPGKGGRLFRYREAHLSGRAGTGSRPVHGRCPRR